MNYHNLRTVVSFEVRRTITKKRFWITTLIVPVVISIVFGLIYASNGATKSSLNAQKHAAFTFAYSDASGLILGPVVKQFGGRSAIDVARGIADVKAGRLDAFFVYPADPVRQPVRVYGVDVGIFNNGKYATVATEILQLSADAKIGSPSLAKLARGILNVQSTTFKNGVPSSGLKSIIPPLLFLVVFYVVIVVLGNQMLNSTLEEKENRVTEMILTTMNPNTLITGKILSLLIAGIVQMAVFMSPILIGYFFFRSSLNLPNLDLSTLVFTARQMVVGALLLLGGFTLFTGTLVGIGAIMPTAKEAGAFFGVLMIMLFIPFYVVSLIVSHPGALIVQVFTYFPYTAPITGMFRNAFGSFSIIEEIGVIIELFAVGFLAMRLAIQFFRYGATEYTRKVSIRMALGLTSPWTSSWRRPR